MAGPTLLGVAGWPIAHSRSPQMFAPALAAAGLDWRYLRLPLPPERFAATARALGASGYRGINVTMPHKAAAHALADELTPAAAAIGAVNTLTFGDGPAAAAAPAAPSVVAGAIHGDNTDAGGFLDALGDDPAGWRCLVLGAGGSARAVVWALREAGAEVAVWNRTAERAAALADQLEVAHAAAPGPADLVVNCTSVGLDQATAPDTAAAAVGLDGSDPPAVLFDLTYGAGATPLTRWAARAGARTIDGAEMLVRQGARSFERWTGRPADLEAMRAGVRS